MKDPNINLDEIRRLLALFDENALAELEVEEDGVKLSLRRETVISAQNGASDSIPMPVLTAPAPIPASAAAEQKSLPADTIEIQSPMTGVFYTNPSPNDPTFVEVGDEVQIGQTVGLIEAMKVFSEVPADAAGKVVALPVRSGELVQQGQTLVILEPI